MKKLFIISLLFLTSCQEEVIEPNQPVTPIECDCYEQHEQMGAGGVWYQTYNTTPQPDLCSKETGTYIDLTIMTRYKVVCN